MLSQEETEMQNYCRNIETDTMKAIKAYIDKEERRTQKTVKHNVIMGDRLYPSRNRHLSFHHTLNINSPPSNRGLFLPLTQNPL